MCPVNCSPMLVDTRVMFSPERLNKGKYAAGSITFVLRIRFPIITGTHWQRFPDIPQQLVRFFIHAYNRTYGIVWHFVYIRDILHTCCKFCIFFFRDAPVTVFVRSEPVFFNALPMAFLPTGTSSSILAFSSKRRSVHLAWPSGTGPQAISMMWASALPSSFRRALSEFALRFKLVMPPIPSFINSFTVFVTVAGQTPFVLADCS